MVQSRKALQSIVAPLSASLERSFCQPELFFVVWVHKDYLRASLMRIVHEAYVRLRVRVLNASGRIGHSLKPARRDWRAANSTVHASLLPRGFPRSISKALPRPPGRSIKHTNYLLKHIAHFVHCFTVFFLIKAFANNNAIPPLSIFDEFLQKR